MRSYKKLALGAGMAMLSVGALAGQAMADPPTTPSDSSLVAVGSDTIQSVSDQFSTDYTGTPSFNSYDATDPNNDGSTTITPKVGCTAITRPNGSGSGISALGAGARPNGDSTDYCIDIARSSRVLGPTDPAGLAGVQFAGDAVTWSAEKTTNAPVTLTTADLTAIYSCDDTSLGGDGSPVTWSEVGGTGNDAVVPVIPQSSSGTRSFFLSKIGVTTLGSCVVPTDNTVEENEGNNAVFTNGTVTTPAETVNTADIVFPYSIAVYLSQTEHGHTANGTPGPLVLKEVNGVKPTSGSGSKLTINKKSPYSRDVYYVVRSTGKSAGYVPTYLQSFLGKNSSSGWICKNATAKKDIASYGFLNLGSKCGKIGTTN